MVDALLPRRHRCGVRPQLDTVAPRNLLGKRIGSPILGRLFTFGVPVLPCVPTDNLRQTYVQRLWAIWLYRRTSIRRGNHNLAEDASIGIIFMPFDADGFIENQVDQVLVRPLPVGLRLLRRLDAGNSDVAFFVVAAQDCDGVAVGYADDPAGQRVGASSDMDGE